MQAAQGASLLPGTIHPAYPNYESQESITIEQFMQEGDLKKIGSGWQVRVVANPNFPHHIVKEYNCSTSNLQYLYDNEVSAIKRIESRLQDEKLSRVVCPKLFGAKIKGQFLYEMFPRIYPPDAKNSENCGEMIGISFSKQSYRVDGHYYQAGRGHICEPQHLERYFHEDVPLILKELGHAFALLHFKAFVVCRDVEIVIGKLTPLGPLKLFIIDFDRAGVEPIFSRDDFLKKCGQNMTAADYFRSLYSFGESDVFQEFSKVDEKYKKPFVQGYLERAETLGFHSEAEAIVKKLG